LRETSLIDHRQYFAVAMDQLNAIEEKRRKVCDNAEKMENELREVFKNSISKLHEITQLKLSTLLSDEAELRRRLEELEWVNKFIQYEKENVRPVNFLDSFTQHSLLKRDKIEGLETCLQNAAYTVNTIQADIHVKGSFQVYSESTKLEENPEYNIIPLIDHERLLYDEKGNMVLNTEVEEEESGIVIDDETLLLKNQKPNECIIC
jgi:oligoribonuclease NrnB/cAMP/cGMP phosphodiesterase (DHH superfamily)